MQIGKYFQNIWIFEPKFLIYFLLQDVLKTMFKILLKIKRPRNQDFLGIMIGRENLKCYKLDNLNTFDDFYFIFSRFYLVNLEKKITYLHK